MTEGNVLAAAQEIDRLKILCDDGAVTLDKLKNSLADHARFNVYTLCDACLAGDFRQADRMLARLESEGVEPVIATWAIARDIRALLRVKQGMAAGEAFAPLCQSMQIWAQRQSLFRRAMERLSLTDLMQLMQLAAGLDQSVKGQSRHDSIGSNWFQIKQVCARLSGLGQLTFSDSATRAA